MSSNDEDPDLGPYDAEGFTASDHEGHLLLAVTVALCSCIHMFSWWTGEPFLDYQNSVGFLVLLYGGWCVYVAWWGIRWRRLHKR